MSDQKDSKLKALQLTLDKLDKTYGKGSVMKLGDQTIEKVEAISSGSIGLDIALGVGGYPKGRVIEIYGPESSGKTTLTLHAIAECQKAGGIAAFIDAEHAFDRFYAQKLGVDLGELVISQPDNGEQALEIADNLAKYFGNIANTFTVGAGALKDIYAQLDPDYRKLPDNTDVNMWEYFLKQAGRSIPVQVGEGEGQRRQLESATRSGGIRRVNPIIKQLTGLSPVEQRTVVEDELKRLKFDYAELSPYRIKFDKPLSNEARGKMGQFVERNVRSFIMSDDYLLLPNDIEKRKRLKQEVNAFRTMSRNMVMDPDGATTKAEFRRKQRATFLNMPKTDRRILEARYKSVFPDLHEEGIEQDGAFWMVDY